MKRALIVAVVAATLLALHFGAAATGGHVIVDRTAPEDVLHVGQLYERWGAYVADGHLPLWFPEFGGGYPVHAAWMYGMLYPGLLLFAFLPMELAWTWTAILHGALGAAGMYKLARDDGFRMEAAAAAALLFATSEFVIGRTQSGHLNLVMAVAWAPWVIFHARRVARGTRGAAAWLAICGGFGLLAGHVQVWFYLAPLTLLMAWFARPADAPARALGRLALAALGVLAVAAAQVFTTAELVAISGADSPAADLMGQGSLSFSRLLHYVAPGAFGFRSTTYWGPDVLEHETLAISGVWLLLPLWQLHRRWDRSTTALIVATLLALFIAIGHNTAVGEWLHSVPPLSFARTSARAMVVALITVPFLVARGVDAWMAREEALKLRDWRLYLPFVICLAAIFTAAKYASGLVDVIDGRIETTSGWIEVGPAIDSTTIRLYITGLGALFAVALAMLFVRTTGWRRWLPAAALALAGALAASPPTATRDAEPYYRNWSASVPEDAQVHRVHLAPDNRFPHVERGGIRTVRQLCHLDTEAFVQLWYPPNEASAYWMDVAWQAQKGFDGLVIDSPKNAEVRALAPGWRLEALGPGAVFRPEGASVFRDEGQPVARVRAGDPRLHIPGDTEGMLVLDRMPGGAVSRLPSDGPLEVNFAVTAPGPAWVVFSEKDYPGWEARIAQSGASDVGADKVPIIPGNGALRAVRVPGSCEVRMRFRPLTVSIGTSISIFALICAGIGIWSSRSSRGTDA